jgi:ATP-binding cassette, subfamily B, bacterial PglK
VSELRFKKLTPKKLQDIYKSIIIFNKFLSNFEVSQYPKVLILMLGAALSGVLEILGIVGLYYLIMFLIKMEELGNGHIIKKVFNFLEITNPDYQTIILGALITLVFVVKNIFVVTYYNLEHTTLKNWKIYISSKLMKGYLNMPYIKLLKYDSVTIQNNINSISYSAINGYILSFLNFTSNLITGLMVLSLIYIKFLKTSLLIAAILTTATIIQNYFLKGKYKKLGKERDRLKKKQDQIVFQGFFSIRETKVLGKENFFLKSFFKINEVTAKNDSQNILYSRIPTHLTEITIILTIITICLSVMVQETNSQIVPIAGLGALAAIAFRMSPIMNKGLTALQMMHTNENSINLLLEELKNTSFNYRQNPLPKQTTLNFQKSIEFKNVTFHYPETKEPTLKDVNFKIMKGEYIGIMGDSGSGKTTLIDLILGLLTPNSGEILIDGVALNPSNLKGWQEQVSFVPQSIYLTDDLISKNIAYGAKEGEIDQAKVNKYLEKTLLDDLKNDKRDNQLFNVGENGKNLSGGERQRIAIARALFQEKNTIILDEATSALDVNSEKVITEELTQINNINNRKTIIAVSHRLGTILKADKIIIIKDGKIEGIDDFYGLYEKNKEFKKAANHSGIFKPEKTSLTL